MTKTRETRIKRTVTPVPQNLDESAKFLSKIGEEKRKVNNIQSDFNAEVERLKKKAMANTKTHDEKISQLVEGLFAYAQSHRSELTNSGKYKTVNLPTGTFEWRLTRPKVSLKNVKSILEALKELGLKRFIRKTVTEEVNKEKMLKEPNVAEKVEGVSITQHEEFIVKPAELKVEIPFKVKKLQKAISKKEK